MKKVTIEMDVPTARNVADAIRTAISEMGGCDHKVGICVCREIQVLETLERRILDITGEPKETPCAR